MSLRPLVLLSAGLIAFTGSAARTYAQQPLDTTTLTIHTQDARIPFSIQIANTPDALSRGLMYVESLPPRTGMLFDFGMTRDAAMWMKNTLIPLDMLFISEERVIIQIVENAKPHDETLIRAEMPVHYVLELPAGSVREYGIAVNDTLSWDDK